MAVKASSLSCLASSLSSPYQTRRRFQPRLSGRLYDSQRHDSWQLKYAKVESCNFVNGIFKFNGKFSKRKSLKFSNSHGQSQSIDQSVASEQDDYQPNGEDVSPSSNLYLQFRPTGGKPGLISFYNHPYKDGNKVRISSRPENHQNSVLWFMGPAILVASFVFPSLYLRRILSIIFEDSLLTDFLILFFTEALFYCGVGVFLLLIDILRRPTEPDSSSDSSYGSQALGQRISSVAVLVLSLIIPMVTMGFVWPWTGPAASATLAPYLVGIVVQFAFEQYARRKKSPSWPVIPIIFQVYRLHQLNRAAQLVTALTFTVRGVEMTPHNISINSSLGTLHNVLHCLGVICIWSLSSFLMRFFPIA